MPSALKQRTRDALHQTSNIIVFSYALAGLGHLRVTDALYHGLPVGSRPLALGSQDETLTAIHRITSIHPWARRAFEWFQQGWGEDLFTYMYRGHLRRNTDLIYKQLKTVITQRYNRPAHIVIVATHFSLAHQLAEITSRINKEYQTEISLIVQVTDDSPQQIWYVYGADVIVVPSEYTKSELLRYARYAHLPRTKIVVNPYPVSPYLASFGSMKRVESRMKQLSNSSRRTIHVAIPVSGAAVGLSFASDIMRYLHAENERYRFHIVTKDAPFTQEFIRRVRARSYVELYASDMDRKVVDAYQALYQDTTIAFEITKPSEQAFKALLTTRHNGGSILLFTQPVGRQEYDNMNFLKKHRLIPSDTEHERLYEFFRTSIGFAHQTDAELFSSARGFRGVRIPSDPREAAGFIEWGLRHGLFMQMARKTRTQPDLSEHYAREVSADGVDQFWNIVTDELLT